MRRLFESTLWEINNEIELSSAGPDAAKAALAIDELGSGFKQGESLEIPYEFLAICDDDMQCTMA